MASEVSQDEFSQLFQGKEVRPHVARQVSLFITSNDYEHGSYMDSLEAKADFFLRQMERKGYAQREKTGREAGSDSLPLAEMHKGWGIRDQVSGEPKPIRSSKFSLGTLFYFFRNVANPKYFLAIINELWSPEEFAFQRLYHAKFSPEQPWDGFDQISARFNAPSKDIRAAFREIWSGEPLGPVERVPLGKFELLLGRDETVSTRAFEVVAPQDLVEDKQPNVYAALNWRARLSELHGRKKQIKRLLDWAQDGDYHPKLMLINGSGGVGKSRMIAEVVATLKDGHGWVGGELPHQIRDGDVIAADGEGVAFVIDYPEENFDLVRQLVEACGNTQTYSCPVRIFLASRESMETWQKMLNKPYLANVSELSLEVAPFLNKRDGKSVATEVAKNYAKALKKSPPKLEGIAEWREQRPSHSLPLMLVAAAVHAVLDPSNAFALSGKDLLLELARIELRRVRSYSKRDLGASSALEKLLALAVLTPDGLTKDSVFELAEKDICPGTSGVAMLEAVQRTPYWRKSEQDKPGHVVRIQPDRPAAALLYLALGLDDETSPALPDWLGVVATKTGEAFRDILGRVTYDLSQIESQASRTIEVQAVQMLCLNPGMAIILGHVAARPSTPFTANFTIKLIELLLSQTKVGVVKPSLLNNLSNALSESGRYEEALAASSEAIAVVKSSGDNNSLEYLKEVAGLLAVQSGRFADLGRYHDAVLTAEEAVEANRVLYSLHPLEFGPGLAKALHNYGQSQVDLGQPIEALKPLSEAECVFKELLENTSVLSSDEIASNLSTALIAKSNVLAVIGRPEEGLAPVQEALQLTRTIAEENPEIYQVNLARAMSTTSVRHYELRQLAESLDFAQNALRVFEHLSGSRPEAFSAELCDVCNNISNIYVGLGMPSEALPFCARALEIRKSHFKKSPAAYREKLAGSFVNLARILALMSRHEDAISPAQDAVLMLREITQEFPERMVNTYNGALYNFAKMHHELGKYEGAIDFVEAEIEWWENKLAEDPKRFAAIVMSIIGIHHKLCANAGRDTNPEFLRPLRDLIIQTIPQT